MLALLVTIVVYYLSEGNVIALKCKRYSRQIKNKTTIELKKNNYYLGLVFVKYPPTRLEFI